MSERATDFLQEKVAITNVMELVRGEKIKRDFESQVISDTAYESYLCRYAVRKRSGGFDYSPE